MKKNLLTPTLLTTAVLLISACASTPRTTGLLDQTRSAYVMTSNNPDVERYAPAELQQATVAMNQANAASSHRENAEEINKLAYIAKDKIALANEVTKQKLAEAQIASTAKQRDQMVLNQRTLEADKAKQDAANAQAQAAILQAQLADMSAKQTDRGIVITLGDVLFGIDQSNLNSSGLRTVQKLAEVLNKNPQRTVLIEGYTDSTGTASHNQELSERRAQSVRSALQERGISGDRISTRGYGQQFPVAPNDTAGNRQMNRRVEIVLSDDNGKIIPHQ